MNDEERIALMEHIQRLVDELIEHGDSGVDPAQRIRSGDKNHERVSSKPLMRSVTKRGNLVAENLISKAEWLRRRA